MIVENEVRGRKKLNRGKQKAGEGKKTQGKGEAKKQNNRQGRKRQAIPESCEGSIINFDPL